MVFSPISRVCKGAMCPSKLWFIVWSKYIQHPVSYYIYPIIKKNGGNTIEVLFVLMQNPEMFNSDHAWLEKQLLNADRVTLEWQSPQHSRMTHRRTVGSRWMHQRHWAWDDLHGLVVLESPRKFLKCVSWLWPLCSQTQVLSTKYNYNNNNNIYIYTQYVLLNR